MPEICRFYGIVIAMFGDEHPPPHLHAKHGGDRAVFELRSGEMTEGWIPARSAKLVKRWISLHRDELLEMWDGLQGEYKSAWKIAPLD